MVFLGSSSKIKDAKSNAVGGERMIELTRSTFRSGKSASLCNAKTGTPAATKIAKPLLTFDILKRYTDLVLKFKLTLRIFVINYVLIWNYLNNGIFNNHG